MFYLAIIQNDTTQALYRYDTYDQALATFHSELAYRGDARMKTVCVILNSIGELIKRDYWERPVTEQVTGEEES